MRTLMHMQKSRQGNALVLAVLVLLALTSVGIIAVQRTNTDLMSAGNLVRASQAYSAGEAGMSHGLGRVGELPNKCVDDIHAINMTAGTTTRTIEVARFSTSIPNPTLLMAEGTGQGSNHYLPLVAADANPGNETASERVRQDTAYLVDAFWLSEVKGMAGYDADGSGCMQTFDFNALGGIPTMAGEEVSNPAGTGTMNRMDTVVVRVRARALAGPTPCRLR